MKFLDQTFLGQVDRVRGQGTELAQRIEGARQQFPLILERRQGSRNGPKRLVHQRLLIGELAYQVVEAVRRVDDVARLAVQRASERVQLLNQAAQVLRPTRERTAQRLGDVLYLANAAAIENQRQRRKRLFRRRIAAACGHRKNGAVAQPALGRNAARGR